MLWHLLASPAKGTTSTAGFGLEPATAIVEQSRAKSEADRQIERLNSLRGAASGWAGPGSSAPDKSSLQAAVDLIRRLKNLPLPIPMASIGSDGNAGLFWSDDRIYADLEVFPDGRIGYLLQLAGRDPIDSEEDLPSSGLPPAIAIALATAYLSNER